MNKFKRHGKLLIPKHELIKISEKIIQKKAEADLAESKETIYFSEVDRVTKIYKLNKSNNRKVAEITCVSFDVKIDNKWITIIYYDSYHDGELHKHIRISLEDDSDSPITEGVRKKGTQHRLLTWAMQDLVANYLVYKSKFFKRSKISLKDSIDMQYK
jgi:hypothetical protein